MKKKYVLLLPILLTSCFSNNTVKGEIKVKKEATKITINNKEDIAKASLNMLQDTLKSKSDLTLSIASYALAFGGLYSISEDIERSASNLGFSKNPLEDTKSLLSSFNWSYNNNKNFIKSCILHQQVGEQFKFSNKKMKEVSKYGFDTMISTKENAINDAKNILNKRIGLDITFSNDEKEMEDCVITYGAIRMCDNFSKVQKETDNIFNLNSTSSEIVKTYAFSDYLPYYETETYQMCSIEIKDTSLWVILPKINVDLNSIDILKAYNDFKENKKSTSLHGYVPYFHLNSSLQLPFTTNIEDKYYTKLLEDENTNLEIIKVLQATDFTFSKKGSMGQSVTSITLSNSSVSRSDEYIEFNVNRPFYAFSIYDDFPMFINKVSKPTLS